MIHCLDNTKASQKGNIPVKIIRLNWDLLSDCSFNPLQLGVAYLCPLKTSENFRFSDIFGGYR